MCAKTAYSHEGDAMSQIRSLTSLRFFAAIVVVFCHLDILANSQVDWVKAFYKSWCSEGFIGVTFFFVLSGFILSHANAGRSGQGGIGFRRFLAHRFARIYPLHLLTFILSLPLVWAVRQRLSLGSLTGGLLSNLLLLQAYVPVKEVYFSANHPAWSLSVEFFFYALFPFLFGWRMRSLLALMLLGAGYQLALAYWSEADFVAKHWQHLAYVFPPARLVDFLSGMLLYRLRGNLRITDSTASVLQLLALAALVVQVGFSQGVSMILRSDVYYLPAMCVLVYAFSFDSGILGRRLVNKKLVYLGEISFSLYMVHQLVIRYGEYAISKLGMDDNSLQSNLVFVGVVLVVSMMASVVLFEKVELFAKTWLNRRLESA
jgi:peptidoglycan/LPS O-acetylase OafA/YrhL